MASHEVLLATWHERCYSAKCTKTGMPLWHLRQEFQCATKPKWIILKHTLAGASERGNAFWTAAKETTCGGKFEWCSQKLFFWLKDELAWTDAPTTQRQGRCAMLYFTKQNNTFDVKLSAASCQHKMKIICEVLLYFVLCRHNTKYVT